MEVHIAVRIPERLVRYARKAATRRAVTSGLMIGVVVSTLTAYAVTLPNTFTAGTTASASQVSANFSALKTAVDALEAKGQWDKSGADISYTAGNVGIGTASPGVKLEVAGSVNAQRYNRTTIPTAYTSAAIQVAIDTVGAEGGGLVYLPAGTYAVNTTITLKPNVTIEGAGYNTVLDGTGFAGGIMMELPSGPPYININYHIKDLHIHGSSTAGGSASDAATGIKLPYGTGPGKISNVWFVNLYSYGIYNNFANSVEIYHCSFSDYSGTAMYFTNVYQQQIIGNRFNSAYATYGIQTATWFVENIIVDNNFSLSGANVIAAIYTPIGNVSRSNIISNNKIAINANSASDVYGINNSSDSANITNNRLVIPNAGTGAGIGILSSGTYCNVSANNSKGSKTANSITGIGTEIGGANIDAP